MSQPTRFPWGDFPDVFIHASESLVKRHRAYASAKSGVQANKVNHTGANGYARLQRQAIFSGVASLGLNYVLVDDFIGQGGTLANLRGHILAQGGHVLGATALTGKDYSAKLAPTDLQTAALRRQHGHIEDWWRQRFGFGFNCLTASETRYLCRTSTSERIIERLEEVAG
ncbi:phosphoribosyltransferase [Duganella sp. HH101]|uniref:phosphoribosyltransferase n=1 Tax=Duganella sp. HH101 TaxID=1781066 RepID=UPI0008FC26AA|nr:phosphoribosyltransferase [Duganella sp. HH101]